MTDNNNPIENIITLSDSIGKATVHGNTASLTNYFVPIVKLKSGSTDEWTIEKYRINNLAKTSDVNSVSDRVTDIENTLNGSDGFIQTTEENFITIENVLNSHGEDIEYIKTKVVEIGSSDSAEIGLENNTIYNISYNPVGEIVLPDSLSDVSNLDYISQLNFSVFDGETCTVTPPSISGFEMRWIGDDVEDNEFIPVENRRYSIMFNYDGMFIRAIVQSVKIDLLGD